MMKGLSGIVLSRSEVDQEIALLADLRAQKDEAEQRFRDQERKVIEVLQAKNQASATGGGWRAKVVRKTNVKINEESLKKALGADVWRKVTKTVLDKPRLEEAVTNGLVDPVVVAAHSDVVTVKPYVLLTKKGADEPEE